MKTYRGKVHRINSRRKDADAEIRMVRGNKVSIERIKVFRLQAAGVAYSGAAFFICINDLGARRTIIIKPDKVANRKLDREVRKLYAEDAREVAAVARVKK